MTTRATRARLEAEGYDPGSPADRAVLDADMAEIGRRDPTGWTPAQAQADVAEKLRQEREGQ